MGNFHCIDSTCGEVRYQPYKKTGGIRYRYPGQDWITVDGDDYSVNREIGTCPVLYYAFGEYVHMNTVGCGDTQYWRSAKAINGETVESWEPIVTEYGDYRIVLTDGSYISINAYGRASYEARSVRPKRGHGIIYRTSNQKCVNVNKPAYGYDARLTDVVRVDGEPDDCGSCTLKIFKDNQIVFEQTDDDCPEVENLNGNSRDGCELNDRTEVVRAPKIAYLERLEVVDYAYGLQSIPGVPVPVPQQENIPDECLNVYVNEIYLPVPPDFPEGARPTNGFGFIAQICSDPGCPPPEYEVICDCTKRCPSGTCAKRCGGFICCYGSDGISRQQIPIGDFFPESRGGGTSA